MPDVAPADFPPIELPRAADLVVRALVDGIRAGSITPGSRLPRDHELAARFGVSRPVVRDALDQLRRAGILDVRRGSTGGAFVRAIAIPHALLTDRDALEGEELRQLLRRAARGDDDVPPGGRAREAGGPGGAGRRSSSSSTAAAPTRSTSWSSTSASTCGWRRPAATRR